MSRRTQRKGNISASQIRKAASTITPPHEGLLLSPRTSTNIRKFEAALTQHTSDRAHMRRLVDGFVRHEVPQGQHVMGGGFSRLSPYLGVHQVPSYLDYLNSLYVPTGSSLPVLPGHYYYLDQAWQSSLGGTAASKVNGSLANYSLANVSRTNDSSFAGVYILVSTDQKNYGKLSTVTLEANGMWNAKLRFHSDWEWARKVAGSIQITGRIWLVAYIYNVATRAFDPLLNTSLVARNVIFGTSTGSATFTQTQNGSLEGLALPFIAEPARQYLLGVVTQVQITHNLTNDFGKPLGPPPQGAFTCFGILNAGVDAMYVSHRVLVA